LGLSLASDSAGRWKGISEALTSTLESDGFPTTTAYADDSIEKQAEQIGSLVDGGVRLLAVGPATGSALAPTLQAAYQKGVGVLAIDRPLTDTNAVDGFVGFDSYKLGQLQGQAIADALKLDSPGTHTLEVFAGSPVDPNAKQTFQGAWDVLSPYVLAGKLNILSGKVPTSDDWSSVAVLDSAKSTAKADMAQRLKAYDSEKVDAVLAPSDDIALGVAAALKDAGYTTYPVLTGADAQVSAVKNVISGKQTMTVLEDPRELAKAASEWLALLGSGIALPHETTMNNGVKEVPAKLLEPVVVTKDNYQQVLIDSGFMTAAELGS
jgi:putative multiple sugar transport system substrate-binding protein